MKKFVYLALGFVGGFVSCLTLASWLPDDIDGSQLPPDFRV